MSVGMAAGIANQFMGNFIAKLQGTELPPTEGELRSPSAYHDFSMMNAYELVEIISAMQSVINDPLWDNNMRLHAVEKYSLADDYIGFCNSGKLQRTRKHPLKGSMAAVTADEISSDGTGSCMWCSKEFGLGQMVFKIACGHSLCSGCSDTMPLDWCTKCIAPITDLTDSEFEATKESYARHIDNWLKAWARQRFVPWYLNWSDWSEAAYWAIKKKHITRRAANFKEMEFEPGSYTLVDYVVATTLLFLDANPVKNDFMLKILWL